MITTPPLTWASPARTKTSSEAETLADPQSLIDWLNKHPYSQAYDNGIRKFVDVSTWEEVRWSKNLLLDFSGPEIARVYGYRETVVQLHRTACALAIAMHELPTDTARQETLFTEQRKNVEKFNTLLTMDPLMYIAGPAFHLIDRYHRSSSDHNSSPIRPSSALVYCRRAKQWRRTSL
jgi:hypothetical protein